jgi:hypothetical protein
MARDYPRTTVRLAPRHLAQIERVRRELQAQNPDREETTKSDAIRHLIERSADVAPQTKEERR